MIKGMVMDLDKNRYENFDDLYLYCYRVAGTVPAGWSTTIILITLCTCVSVRRLQVVVGNSTMGGHREIQGQKPV